MSQYDYDLFVIGGGSGGVRGARWAGSLGAKVAICEEREYGGTCVIRGCVPKKLMVYASHLPEELHLMESFGWNTQTPRLDFKKLKINRDNEVQRLSGLYEKILGSSQVEILHGHGKIVDAHTIQVGNKTYTSRHILIATGGKPWRPDIPGFEHTITSDGFFEMEELPQKAIVLGGGYIGVEMAGILNGLGSEVTLVIRGEHLLRGFDQECADFVQEEMSKKGIRILTQTNIKEITTTETCLSVALENGETLKADQVLAATGREPNTDGLGLASCGIQTGKNGEILVNEKSQTNVEHIYAVGDVTDRMNLTPVALEEAMLVAEDLFNKNKRTMTYENIPSAIFSQPPMATVGLSEEELQEKNIPYTKYKSAFRPLKFTLSPIQEKTLMKLLVCPDTQKVLGCHMVGDGAADIIQGLGIAMKAGATKAHFDETIGIHPTSAEEFTTLRTPSS